MFHSMDKMTTMFVHILPSLVTFSDRRDERLASMRFPLYESMDGTALDNVVDFWWRHFVYYAAWRAMYLREDGGRVDKRKLEYNAEMMTSLRLMSRKEDSKS